VSSAEPRLRLHEEPHLDSDPLRLVELTQSIRLTEGALLVAIGLVAGPVALDYPNLSSTNIHELRGNSNGRCADVTGVACVHGTFMAGILSAKRGSAVSTICPGGTLLVPPIFTETDSPREQLPSATPTACTGNPRGGLPTW